MRPLLERGAEMGRPQRDDVRDAPDPVLPELIRLVGSAARDKAAHRMSDERDLLDGDRPRAHQLIEQRGDQASVLGDVQAGVVAQVDRRTAQVLRQPRAICVFGSP